MRCPVCFKCADSLGSLILSKIWVNIRNKQIVIAKPKQWSYDIEKFFKTSTYFSYAFWASRNTPQTLASFLVSIYHFPGNQYIWIFYSYWRLLSKLKRFLDSNFEDFILSLIFCTLLFNPLFNGNCNEFFC